MTKTNTGQAVGILTRWWAPLLIDAYTTPGLPTIMGSAIKSSPQLLRVVVMGGESLRSMERAGMDLSGEPVAKMHLLRYLTLDVTVSTPGTRRVMAMTAVQTADGSGVRHGVYRHDPSGRRPELLDFGWDGFSMILEKLLLSEMWGRITGTVTPSFGYMKDGALYVSEQFPHVGVVRHAPAVLRGDGGFSIDDFDMGRVERVLSAAGVSLGEFADPSVRDDGTRILDCLRAFSRATSPDEWRSVAESWLSRTSTCEVGL